MFSLAAAAALKEGFEVRLLLDDSLIPTPSMRERLINDFRDAVTSWLDRAGAPTERFATTCYSEIVRGAPESAALAFVARFLNNETRASEFIEASKITRDRTAAAVAPTPGMEQFASAFVTPFWNWVVLEHEVRRLADV